MERDGFKLMIFSSSAYSFLHDVKPMEKEWRILLGSTDWPLSVLIVWLMCVIVAFFLSQNTFNDKQYVTFEAVSFVSIT